MRDAIRRLRCKRERSDKCRSRCRLLCAGYSRRCNNEGRRDKEETQHGQTRFLLNLRYDGVVGLNVRSINRVNVTRLWWTLSQIRLIKDIVRIFCLAEKPKLPVCIVGPKVSIYMIYMRCKFKDGSRVAAILSEIVCDSLRGVFAE